jgi:hypothetical protein
MVTVYPLQTEALAKLIQDGPARITQASDGTGAVRVWLDDGTLFKVRTDGTTTATPNLPAWMW